MTCFAILLPALISNLPVTLGAGTVGTSSNNCSAVRCNQRKSFYANGRFWIFYSNGTDMVFRTSTDGNAWGSATSVRTCDDGEQFSIWFDGTYVHYAYCVEDAGVAIYYRRGTPSSGGTITWSAEQTAVAGSSGITYCVPTIATDDSGYQWIGYRYEISSSDKRPYVTCSTTDNGTWSTRSGFPQDLTGWHAAQWVVVPIPLTSRKMLILYNSFGRVAYEKRWTGSSFLTSNNTASATGTNGHFISAVNEGDNVHLVFTTGTSIIYTKFTYSSNKFGSRTNLQASANPPVICRDPNTNNLYVFWAGSPTANRIYYKKCVGGTWDSSATELINESTDGLTGNDRITCFYNKYGVYVGLVYMTKTSSPYNVRFAYLVFISEYPYGLFLVLLLFFPIFLAARLHRIQTHMSKL